MTETEKLQAEVERLKSLIAALLGHSAYRGGFVAGAEAMREAAAQCIEREVDALMMRAGLAADLRDLPIPKDEQPWPIVEGKP
jgi:hypothetical protein